MAGGRKRKRRDREVGPSKPENKPLGHQDPKESETGSPIPAEKRHSNQGAAPAPDTNVGAGAAAQASDRKDRSKKRKKTRNSPAGNAGAEIHPFEADETDHCETPLEAYRDVLELLDKLTRLVGKTRETVRIYDPYYCDGGVQRKLRSLGFSNVINQNEDFYDNIRNGTVPTHDILVTNPPYSGQHMEKLLTFASQASVPFLLLLPHFVYTKDYYDRSRMPEDTFFLVPKSRYSYTPPKWVSQRAGSTALAKGKTQTAPFPSFWYCHGRGMLESGFLTATYGESGKYDSRRRVQYAQRPADLPRDVKGEFDATKKRPNPKARKRLAAKRRKEQGC